jgi:mRNA interferase MazF
VTYDRYDVVVVPFPFTDVPRSKPRSALVLSDHDHFGFQASHSVMAMITSSRNRAWPLDVEITNLASAGLPAPSIVRMKLFT